MIIEKEINFSNEAFRVIGSITAILNMDHLTDKEKLNRISNRIIKLETLLSEDIIIRS